MLVVDDDEGIRHLLQATLEAEGFQVKTARDGRTILDAAQKYSPHLIVCDMMMPGGGGYEVIRAMQSDGATRKIPILLVSGHGFDLSTKDMLKTEPNVVGFFEKPVRPYQFIKKVHEILNTFTREEMNAQKRSEMEGFNKDFNSPF